MASWELFNSSLSVERAREKRWEEEETRKGRKRQSEDDEEISSGWPQTCKPGQKAMRFSKR